MEMKIHNYVLDDLFENNYACVHYFIRTSVISLEKTLHSVLYSHAMRLK